MPQSIYTSLTREAQSCPGFSAPVERVCIGQVWTLVRVNGHTGLCMTPQAYSRTLSWPGDLCGRPASELIAWLDSWQPFETTLAVATLNAVLRGSSDYAPMLANARPLGGGNLAVFSAMRERLGKGPVTVIGRYPGLDDVLEGLDYHCIERNPGVNDLPDQAAETVLPQSRWAFVTASALANRTLPRLLALCRKPDTLLMGPSLPWSRQWFDLGCDYLAGVEVLDEERLWSTAMEGGGVRIFQGCVGYRLLSSEGSLQ
ncbi:Rossmann-like domain-containing protein [Marinobacterium sp. YM272]|uniref:Rossmann-like domain-containing protein n=1 Tax=Marinobacterium sp. YM272 TaxID=3421654 RepID=UPI003D7F3EEB